MTGKKTQNNNQGQIKSFISILTELNDAVSEITDHLKLTEQFKQLRRSMKRSRIECIQA